MSIHSPLDGDTADPQIGAKCTLELMNAIKSSGEFDTTTLTGGLCCDPLLPQLQFDACMSGETQVDYGIQSILEDT